MAFVLSEFIAFAKARLERPPDADDVISEAVKHIRTAVSKCREPTRIEKTVKPGGHKVLYTQELAQAKELLLEAAEQVLEGYREVALKKLAKAEQFIDGDTEQRPVEKGE